MHASVGNTLHLSSSPKDCCSKYSYKEEKHRHTPLCEISTQHWLTMVMQKSKQQHKVEVVKEALKKVEDVHYGHVNGEIEVCSDAFKVDWGRVPSELDPGSVVPARSQRKRQQLSSFLNLFEVILPSSSRGATVCDVGSGSGMLGLLLAHMYPHLHVVCLELSHNKLSSSQQRAETCGVCNVEHVHASAADLLGRDGTLAPDVLIGLHCCGLLTDFALSAAAELNAPFCIAPCCYGQTADSPPLIDPHAKAGARSCSSCVGALPRSKLIAERLSASEFERIARAADVSQQQHEQCNARRKSCDWVGNYTQRARALVNADRVALVHELSDGRYHISVEQLQPEECSGMREVLIGKRIESHV